MVWTTTKTVVAAVIATGLTTSAAAYGVAKYITEVEVREVVRTELAPANDLLNSNDLALAAIKNELEKQTAILTAQFAHDERIRAERAKRFRIETPAGGKW